MGESQDQRIVHVQGFVLVDGLLPLSPPRLAQFYRLHFGVIGAELPT